MRQQVLGFALGASVAVVSLGAGLALRNDGLEFADGSIQTTAAALPAKTAVQVSASVSIDAFDFCSGPQTIYTVAGGKRLAIEWVSIQSVAVDLADPVEVDIITLSGVTSIYHPLARMRNSEVIADSFFKTQIWNSPVRLYSDPGPFQINACRDVFSANSHGVTVTFSGHLVNVP